MKQLIIPVFALLSTIFQAQSMEICDETKKSEKDSLNAKSKYPNYNSLSNRSNNYSKAEDLKIFLKITAQELIPDVQNRIATKFIQLYFSNTSLSCAKLKPLELLHFVSKVQNICPIKIGNKIFEWKDIIVLTKKQQEKLFVVGNPHYLYTCLTGFDNNVIEAPNDCCTKTVYCLPQYCCGKMAPDIKLLEDQPAHIKKNLIVHTDDYSAVCCQCIPACTAGFCLLYPVLGVANGCAISFCSTTLSSWVWWLPMGFWPTCGGLFLLKRFLLRAKNGSCCSNEHDLHERRFE